MAASGIIYKTESSFNIKCLVNTSVSSETKLNFTLTCEGKSGDIQCTLKSVKAPDENQNAQTEIKCSFQKETFTNFLETDNISITPKSKSNSGFEFKNFEKIKSSISARVNMASYNSTEFCKNNNIIFFITASISTNPPLAMNFNLKLKSPEEHQTALCIFPSIENKITCRIDVSEKKIMSGDKISFDEQEIPLENGQKLSISKLNNDLTIETECGEQLNYSLYFKYNILCIALLIIIFFY